MNWNGTQRHERLVHVDDVERLLREVLLHAASSGCTRCETIRDRPDAGRPITPSQMMCTLLRQRSQVPTRRRDDPSRRVPPARSSRARCVTWLLTPPGIDQSYGETSAILMNARISYRRSSAPSPSAPSSSESCSVRARSGGASAPARSPSARGGCPCRERTLPVAMLFLSSSAVEPVERGVGAADHRQVVRVAAAGLGQVQRRAVQLPRLAHPRPRRRPTCSRSRSRRRTDRRRGRRPCARASSGRGCGSASSAGVARSPGRSACGSPSATSFSGRSDWIGSST